METSTITETALEEPQGLFSELDTDEPPPEILSHMLAEHGVFFVDNSGSTSGAILVSEQTFTQRMSPRLTALWNSHPMVRLQDTSTVTWRSEGGTTPSAIYNQGCYPEASPEWTSFTLLTDGQVSQQEVQRLSQHAHKTSHLPTILGISLGSGNVPVSRCNVSVLFSHFTSARTAVLVTMDTSNKVRVIRAKGSWEHEFGDLPELTDTAMLFDFPEVDVERLRSLTCTCGSMQPRNTVLVRASGRSRWLHMDKLLTLPSSRTLVLEGQVSEAEMEDIVRSFHAQGRLAELRRWLTNISSSLLAERQQAERAPVQAPAPAAAGGVSLPTLLSRLRHARSAAEREVIKAQLLAQAGAQSQAATAAKDAKKQEQKSAKRLIDLALQAACALEQAGMGADTLGRLSNRARRAKKIEAPQLKPMSELDVTGAPSAECNVMLDSGCCALLIRRVSDEIAEENTGDFALDFPLVVGCWERNDIFCPDIIGIANGTADQIEAMQTTVLGREDTVVALPVVPLDSQANRSELYKRLCLAFNGGLGLGAVWQVALSSILNTLETKPWAAPGTPMCALLEYLGAEIMANVTLAQGARLSLNRETIMNVAFAESIATRDLAQDYPIEGTVSAAAALLRWGAPIAATPQTYTACVIARAHTALPQQFVKWMKSDRPDGLPCSTSALWRAIYETRSAEGSVIPIAGGHHVPISWDGVLANETRLTLDRFARVLAAARGDPNAANASADALIRPGLAVVIRGCLAGITNQHISSDAAVERARQFHNAVTLELSPSSVGSTTADEALGILAEWLLWARCPIRPLPPFATSWGPSLLYFYHSRTRNAEVTDMTAGFVWNIDGQGEREGLDSRMERLAVHIRDTRGRMLQQEYNFNRDGTFNSTTASLPMYRAMVHEWHHNPDVDPTDGAFVSAVVARLLADKRGNVHAEKLEHDVAMLCHSLKQVGRASAIVGGGSQEYFGNWFLANYDPPEQSCGGSIVSRLSIELAGRTTAEVRVEDAPNAVWVPREDPEMQARLREADAATQRRVEAAQAELARRRAEQPVPSRPRGAPVNKLEGEALERSITKILRHTADKQGVPVRPDGFVDIEKILELVQFTDVSMSEFLTAAITSQLTTKRRHQLKEEDGRLLIRAVQGHSMVCVRPEGLMEEITDPDEVPICIHGTVENSYQLIQASDLNRMSRNEIQMAVGLPEDSQVTSGMRATVEVLIYVDVGRAMRQGIRFFRSANNVICSPGPIPPSCFAHVTRRATSAALQPPAFNRAAQGAPADAAVAARAPVARPAAPAPAGAGLDALLGMGFGRAEADAALRMHNGDLALATTQLLSQWG